MLLLISLLQPFLFFHDAALATFDIRQEDGFITMAVEIDKEDLEKIYKKQQGEVADLTKEEAFVQQYFEEHFYLVINEKKINFNVEVLTQDKHFYHIELASQNKIAATIRHIQLKNTCLLVVLKRHSNIINFHFNDKFRAFRMHKGRKRLEVNY